MNESRKTTLDSDAAARLATPCVTTLDARGHVQRREHGRDRHACRLVAVDAANDQHSTWRSRITADERGDHTSIDRSPEDDAVPPAGRSRFREHAGCEKPADDKPEAR